MPQIPYMPKLPHIIPTQPICGHSHRKSYMSASLIIRGYIKRALFTCACQKSPTCVVAADAAHAFNCSLFGVIPTTKEYIDIFLMIRRIHDNSIVFIYRKRALCTYMPQMPHMRSTAASL